MFYKFIVRIFPYPNYELPDLKKFACGGLRIVFKFGFNFPYVTVGLWVAVDEFILFNRETV